MFTERMGIEHPEISKAMVMQAMSLAPEAMMDEMSAMAKGMGLMPATSGYTADGEPAFALEDIAAKFGMTEEESHAAMTEMLAAREEIGLPTVLIDPATIHRTQ